MAESRLTSDRLDKLRGLVASLPADQRAAVVGAQTEAPQPTWADVMAAAKGAEPKGRVSPARDGASDIEITRSEIAAGYQRVRIEAEQAFGSGLQGTLKWVDSRCAMVPGWHPLDPWWVDAFTERAHGFYPSGKTIMTCRKGLRAGGSSSACRALGNDAVFTERELDPGTIGVIPIISSSRDEATGRFVTLRQLFRAIGIAPEKGDEEEGAFIIPGGVGGTYRSTRSQSGGGIIKLQDSQGHDLQFAIMPAMKRSGVGYTGVCGFIDESDLWPNDPETHVNPAADVIDFVLERFTTQVTAHLYIFSASYNAESAHKDRVDLGDDMVQHLARLGPDGVRVDTEERRKLAEYLASIGVRPDPRLTATGPSDCGTCQGTGKRRRREDGEMVTCGVCRGAGLLAPEDSPDIPAWVTNRSKADILRCYAFSKQNVTRMLARYGGRAAENRGEHDFPDSMANVAIRREAVEWR